VVTLVVFWFFGLGFWASEVFQSHVTPCLKAGACP
jgi:hypothetical protein